MKKFLSISAVLVGLFIYALNSESQPQFVPGPISVQPLITSNTIVSALGFVPASSSGVVGSFGYVTNSITTNTIAGVSNVVNFIATHLVTNVYEFALGDETTATTTGTKMTWRAPFAMTITDVRASLTTASSSGLPTVNILEGGVTIFSTKLTIDANELTSTTAATPYVLSDTALADDASITFAVDVAGTTSAGLKVKIFYTRP
jgi:hypothetical protein